MITERESSSVIIHQILPLLLLKTYKNLNFDIRVLKKLVCPRVSVVKHENLSKFIN